MPLPRVAVLVDLPREAAAGGHVKYWERLAQAAAQKDARVDLTVYFSGTGADEILAPHVRFRSLPPVFSTARLKFLPYVPAHTDLAPFHRQLSKKLPVYDVLHTTDAFFAFARTAERVARQHRLPLVTSFHTDTPAYAELFTRQTVKGLLGDKVGGWADSALRLAARERAGKEKRLEAHLRACDAVLAMRAEDKARAPDKTRPMRLGVDKALFAPQAGMRAATERAYAIPPGKFLVLFVGRVDAGKNIPLLMRACAAAIDQGAPLHLVVVGQGPLSKGVKARLGDHATLTDLLPPEKLAQLYAAADCLAMASDIEIGGMIGLEALACGCPVLASKASGVVPLYGGGDAMVELASEVDAWAEMLSTLARSNGRHMAMRAAALAFRQNKLASWHDVLVDDFLPVWKTVARQEKT